MNILLDVLKEQASFGFTGKVNCLSAGNGQFLAVIYMQDGMLVGAQWGALRDKNALLKLIFEDVDSVTKFRFVVEPEILRPEVLTMSQSFEGLKTEAQNTYQRYLASKKLKPAPHLKLMIDPEIIVSAEVLTPEEYDVLSVLAEWCTVSDVYKYSKLMEFDVTSALVSLRKKKAIKVFQN